MSRIGRTLSDPEDPKAVAEWLTRVQKAIDGDIEFGHPNDSQDLTSAVLAGSVAAAHPGTLMNIAGSWVEVEVETLDDPVTCFHNLDVPVIAANLPNVRWVVFGYQHDGTAVTATAAISCNYESGAPDTIAVNSIQLRFYAAATRTVDGDHPIKATLFFVRAVD